MAVAATQMVPHHRISWQVQMMELQIVQTDQVAAPVQQVALDHRLVETPIVIHSVDGESVNIMDRDDGIRAHVKNRNGKKITVCLQLDFRFCGQWF